MSGMLFKLGFKSLLNRRATSGLTVASIALSVTLLFGVEKIRTGAHTSFANTISQTDLIVGARGGTISLLLYSVFRIGNPTNNISTASYERFKSHPSVAWTIPLSMGDSHRGYRVVGTNESFYKHYRFFGDKSVAFSEGELPRSLFSVAIGSDVAQKLNYSIGSKIILSHGVHDGQAIHSHDDKPFTVTGLIARTGTPIDRTVFISLEGLEAIHIDWEHGVPPDAADAITPDELAKKKIDVDEISAFLLRTKSRIETIGLQREINTYTGEPLLAIIPGVVLNELWSSIDSAEIALRLVTFFVVIVGFIGMLIAIYSSLNERRREIAILRALGFGVPSIVFLLVTESTILTVCGLGIGLLVLYGGLILGQGVLLSKFGLHILVSGISANDLLTICLLIGSGALIGLIPAYRAFRNSLNDGLSVRV
jgi:putative ABC transport system permease protein